MSCARWHGISFSEVDEDEDVFRDDDEEEDADSSPSVEEAPVEDPKDSNVNLSTYVKKVKG